MVNRIAYYTRKVAERGSIHPAHVKPNWYKGRANRLLKYKALMHKQIGSE
jgi:hypothetical protein